MKLFLSNRLVWSTAVLSIILYGASIALVYWDTSFTYRWVAFWLHISAVVVVVGMYASRVLKTSSIRKLFSSTELLPFLVILLITEVANFLYLSSYQFVSISDELRDGGLQALKIANGDIMNIFGYGSYDGYGLIIPTLTRFIYPIFGSSVLTYRVPAAILSTLSVLLVYLLVRKIIGKIPAFWSSFVLATMPLQMFFAHSQVVIGITFLFVPILLIAYEALLKKNRYFEYILMGSLLGFSAGFYAATRVFACLLMLMIVVEGGYRAFMQGDNRKSKVFKWFGTTCALVIFACVGFGPRVIFSNTTNFFHTSRLPVKYSGELKSALTREHVLEIKNNYVKSLMVYGYENTTFFYPVHKPLFSPFMSLFFLLGIGYSFFILKKRFVNRLLILVIVLPFLLSAITDVINADHRLSTLLAVASIFAGIGISYALGSIRNVVFRYLLGIVIAVVLLMQIATYYIEMPANKSHDMKSYVHMHAMMKLQELTDAPMGIFSPGKKVRSGVTREKYCLRFSPANYEFYTVDWGHKEQVEYFLPGTEVTYVGDEVVGENEVYIEKDSCFSGSDPEAKYKLTRIECAQTKSFECPVDYRGEIRMYYE